MKHEKCKFDTFFKAKTKNKKRALKKRRLQEAEFNEDLDTFFPSQSKEEEEVVSVMD